MAKILSNKIDVRKLSHQFIKKKIVILRDATWQEMNLLKTLSYEHIC